MANKEVGVFQLFQRADKSYGIAVSKEFDAGDQDVFIGMLMEMRAKKLGVPVDYYTETQLSCIEVASMTGLEKESVY